MYFIKQIKYNEGKIFEIVLRNNRSKFDFLNSYLRLLFHWAARCRVGVARLNVRRVVRCTKTHVNNREFNIEWKVVSLIELRLHPIRAYISVKLIWKCYWWCVAPLFVFFVTRYNMIDEQGILYLFFNYAIHIFLATSQTFDSFRHNTTMLSNYDYLNGLITNI